MSVNIAIQYLVNVKENKILAIKATRQVTGMGLREAKEMNDTMLSGNNDHPHVTFHLSDEQFAVFMCSYFNDAVLRERIKLLGTVRVIV